MKQKWKDYELARLSTDQLMKFATLMEVKKNNSKE